MAPEAEPGTTGGPAEPSQAEIETKGSPDAPPEMENGMRDELGGPSLRPPGTPEAGAGTGGPDGAPPPIEARGANAPLEMPEGAPAPSLGGGAPDTPPPPPIQAPPG